MALSHMLLLTYSFTYVIIMSKVQH